MAKVSICIPTYNKSGIKHSDSYNNITMLLDLFESIKAQTFKDYEVIISDHSSDNSIFDICEKWKNELNIFYHRYEENYGSCESNLNNSIKLAGGKYIKPMLQDDYFFSNDALEKQVNILNKDIFKWVASGCLHIKENEKNNLYNPHPPLLNDSNSLLTGNNLIGSPSVIMHINDRRVYDVNLIWLMDSDFYYSLFIDYGLPCLIKDLDFISRIRVDGISDSISPMIKGEEIKYLKDKHMLKIDVKNLEKYPNMNDRILKLKTI